MFNKKQLDTIREVAKEGLSHKTAASRLGMTYSDFLDAYNDSKDAQKSFEKGESDLEVEVVTVARAGMYDGDKNKFDFFANKVNGKQVNKDLNKPKAKEDKVPSLLLNPDELMDLDDLDLETSANAKHNTATETIIDEEEEE